MADAIQRVHERPRRWPRSCRAAGGRPSRAASTATGSPASWPSCSARRSRDGRPRPRRRRRERLVPRPVFCVAGQPPRPRGRRGRVPRRPLHPPGDDARPRAEPGLARRGDARRRGVADRVDEVLRRPRPRPRLHRTGDAATCATWQGLVASFIARSTGRGRRTPPTSPPAGCRTGSTPGRRSPPPPATPGCADDLARRLVDRIGADGGLHRATPDGRAQPPHARALRAARRRARLPELDRDGGRCATRWPTARNLLTDIWPDGVHRERSTHYHCIVAALVPRRARERPPLGLAFPDGYDERLRARLRLRAALPPPGRRRSPALSDGDEGDFRDLLALAADLLDRPELRWAATAGAARHAAAPGAGELPRRRLPRPAQRLGRPRPRVRRRALVHLRLRPARRRRSRPLRPAQPSSSWPAAARSWWTRAATPTPRSEPNWRHWFKGTAAHNTVVRRRSRPDALPPRQAEGHRSPLGCSSRADSAPARRAARRGAQPSYDAVHIRRSRSSPTTTGSSTTGSARRPRTATPRLHLAPGAAGPGRRSAPRRRLRRARAGRSRSIVAGDAMPALEDGWVAPDYGVKLPAPVVTVVAGGAADATSSRVVVPLADDAGDPDVALRREDAARGRGHRAGRRGPVRWSGRPARPGRGAAAPPPGGCAAGWTAGPRPRRGRRRRRWAGWDAGRGMSAAGERAVRCADAPAAGLAPDPAAAPARRAAGRRGMRERLSRLLGRARRRAGGARPGEVPRRREPARRLPARRSPAARGIVARRTFARRRAARRPRARRSAAAPDARRRARRRPRPGARDGLLDVPERPQAARSPAAPGPGSDIVAGCSAARARGDRAGRVRAREVARPPRAWTAAASRRVRQGVRRRRRGRARPRAHAALFDAPAGPLGARACPTARRPRATSVLVVEPVRGRRVDALGGAGAARRRRAASARRSPPSTSCRAGRPGAVHAARRARASARRPTSSAAPGPTSPRAPGGWPTRSRPPRRRPGETVCLHGDVHPKNAIVQRRPGGPDRPRPGGVGPPAADLGSAAGRRCAPRAARRRGGPATSARSARGARRLRGRAAAAVADELRWHIAAACSPSARCGP